MRTALNKSLMALDSAADELLLKSQKADVDPDEVSDDSADDDDDANEDNADKSVKKSRKKKAANDDMEKCDSLKKSDDDDDDDEDEDDNTDEVEKARKSIDNIQEVMTRDFYTDEDIASGAATSEFQAAMVQAITKSLSEIQYDIHSSARSNDSVAEVMAKSINAIVGANLRLQENTEKLTKRISKMEKSIRSLSESLDSMASTPAYSRKSVDSISVHDRNFAKSISGSTGFESLSKSQVLSVLNTELYSGNPEVQPTDIISFESGAPLRPELQALVTRKCK